MSKKAVGLAGLAGLTGLGNKESVDNNEQTQSHSGSVYSTEVGRVCPGCGKAKGQCA